MSEDAAVVKQADRVEELRRVLASDPVHPRAVFELSLLEWRRGEISDIEVLDRLSEVASEHPDDWQPVYHQARVHIERGDADGAVELLAPLAARKEGGRDVRRALAVACEHDERWTSLETTLETGIQAPEALCWAPDGKRLLVGYMDQTCRLFDLETGRCLRILGSPRVEIPDEMGAVEIPPGGCYSVAFTPGGERAVTTNGDHLVRVWDLESGRLLHELVAGREKREATSDERSHNDLAAELKAILEGRALLVHVVAVGPDGRAVSFGEDGVLRIWDVEEGRCLAEQVVCGQAAGYLGGSSMDLGSDGARALIGHGDPELWDLQSGESLGKLEGHEDGVNSVALDADGRMALTASDDAILKLWDLERRECVRTFEGHQKGVAAVAFSPAGDAVFSASNDGSVRVWEPATGRCLRTLARSHSYATALALSPDGARLASSDSGGRLHVWRLGAAGPPTPLPEPVLEPAEGADGDLAAAEEGLQRVRDALQEGRAGLAGALLEELRGRPGLARRPELLELWNDAGLEGRRIGLRGGWLARDLQTEGERLAGMEIDPLGRLLTISKDLESAGVSEPHWLGRWDLATGEYEPLGISLDDVEETVAMDAGPGGERVFLGLSRSAAVWHLETGQEEWSFQSESFFHDGDPCTVAFGSDGRTLVSGWTGGRLSVHDLDRRELRWSEGLFSRRWGRWFELAVSPDCRWILVGRGERSDRLELWDLKSGKSLRRFGEGAVDLAVSPDGGIAIALLDGDLQLWQLPEGELLQTLEVDAGGAASIAFGPDGRWAASAGYEDRAVRVWDLEEGRCVRAFHGHLSAPEKVCFTSNGRWLASADDLGRIKVWQLDWDFDFPETGGSG